MGFLSLSLFYNVTRYFRGTHDFTLDILNKSDKKVSQEAFLKIKEGGF